MLWGTGIGQFFFSIRKQHTVNKGTRVQGTCSEYFRGVVFSYSFSIYCAANHGILCSGCYSVGAMKDIVHLHKFQGKPLFMDPKNMFMSHQNFSSWKSELTAAHYLCIHLY